MVTRRIACDTLEALRWGCPQLKVKDDNIKRRIANTRSTVIRHVLWNVDEIVENARAKTQGRLYL